MLKKRATHLGVIGIFTPIGLATSAESILAHYDVVSSGFCTLGTTFNCDIVNKSSYSEILGIPVAALGLLAYLAFAAGWLLLRRGPSDKILLALSALAAAGLTFSLYLTYIEAFVLYTWCLVCLTSLLSIVAITVSLFALREIDGKITVEEKSQ